MTTLKTLVTVYLTALHIIAIGSVFLFTTDQYQLVRIEHSVVQAECCNGDELTAYLDKQEHSRKGK